LVPFGEEARRSHTTGRFIPRRSHTTRPDEVQDIEAREGVRDPVAEA